MGYEPGVPKIPAAAITVEDAGRLHRLARRGVTVRVHIEMGAHSEPDREQATVIAELRGRERPDEIVLVGGHLDSWDVGTGAHDDGAGCAIAAGAAKLIKSLGLRPRRTVRVVLFANEEFGGDAGRAYLEAHRAELDRHVAAIESDSGCFPPTGFSVRATPAVLARVKQLAAPLAGLGAAEVFEGWAGVDIGPIVEQGVPGLAHRTDNAESYFLYHHSPADTFDKIKPADLTANVTAVAALVWAIADDPVSLRSVGSAQE
jgi:carboxypeptidase Q